MSTAAGKLVFCEGKEDGLDIRVLNRLQRQPGAEIVRFGSKYALTSFVQGYVAQSKVSYLIVRDRDFDHEPVGQPALIPIDNGVHPKRVFAWFRHEIENYLLEPRLLDRYFREEESRRGQKHKGRSLPELQQIESALDAAAAKLTCYQAARWALGRINQTLEPEERRRRTTTWMSPPEGLPTDLSEPACRRELQDMVCSPVRQLSLPSAPQIEALFDRFHQLFSDDVFVRDRQYLIWFSGKNLMKQLWRELGLPGGDGCNHIDIYRRKAPEYIAEMSPLPPDLLELQERIAGLSLQGPG